MTASNPGRILVVEDEAILRRLVCQFLRGEGYELVEAGDGREGVVRFEGSGPFDLVLLDLNLPELPGVEVCRAIKRRRPDQPVIICSATILDAHLEALATLHVHRFLTKPFHPEELLGMIRREIPHATVPDSPSSWPRAQATPTPRHRPAAPAPASPARSLVKPPTPE